MHGQLTFVEEDRLASPAFDPLHLPVGLGRLWLLLHHLSSAFLHDALLALAVGSTVGCPVDLGEVLHRSVAFLLACSWVA